MNVKLIILSCLVYLPGSAKGEGTVVERGAHYNIVESLEYAEVDGEAVTIPHRYTELGSGLNYWSAEQGGWLPSTDVIELLQSGAVYRQGPYRLLFAENINDPNGNLEWFPSDNTRIVIQTIGLAITEEETGDSVWIGQIKDAQGFLTGQNEVTWPACFDGIDASVRVTVRPSGFENDIILYEQLPDVGFQGTCRLEAWHQIISGPEPQLRPTQIQRSEEKFDSDTTLQFDEMIIGSGTAFRVGGQIDPAVQAKGRVPVAKEYFVDPANNMRFLIESVPLGEAVERLRLLPPSRHALNFNEKVKGRLVAARGEKSVRRRPMALQSKTSDKSDRINIAAITPKKLPSRDGFLLDFATLTTVSNQIFAGNITYYVASNSIVNITGSTVIEPGTVVKFGQYFTNGTPVINIMGTLDCQTRPYAPAVFTSCEDRTIGETNTALAATINTNVAYGAYHLVIQPSDTGKISLHDVRSLYASNSFAFNSTNQLEAWNVQAARVSGNVLELGSKTNAIRNLLAHNVGTVITARSNNVSVLGEHFTIHAASKAFSDGSKTSNYCSLINPLLISVTNASSTGFSTTSGYTNSSDTGIFQTVGSGAHYLADGSPYRNAGTISISTNLTGGIFKYSTTYPPLIIVNNVTTDTILNPQAVRDTDVPDLGYHYPAFDWAIGGITISDNIALTLTNGASIATFGATAITIGNGGSTAKFISEGTALNRNKIVRYNTVQEQPIDWGTVSSTVKMFTWTFPPSQLILRQTELGYMAYTTNSSRIYVFEGSKGFPSTLIMRDCEVYTGHLSLNVNDSVVSTAGLTNNVFHRAYFPMAVQSGSQSTVYAKNNFFRYSCLPLNFAGTGTWSFQNNFFDRCTNTITAGPANSYNGYYATTALPSGSNNQTVSLVDFQSGAQGPWYYPTSGTTNLFILVDAGSTSVTNTGLYHYTTRVDHTKDSGMVDIGYHYVAIDGNGPIDTDSDGVPDYLEDRNGDGSASGDTRSWQSYNSAFTLTGVSDLHIFTPLK